MTVVESHVHSWLPVDLIGSADTEPVLPSIGGLIYPGLRHVLSGEPESLKSWLALILAHTQIDLGMNVLYVDMEMGIPMTLGRLRDLGIPDSTISDRFVYLAPEGPIGQAGDDIELLLAETNPSLVVFDSFVGALQLHGLKPKDDIDIETFYRAVVDRFRKRGAAVILLDHVVKDKDARGRWSTGSERKVGAAEVHLGLEMVRAFGRGREGLARVTVHKDRAGYLPRPRAAELDVRSDPITNAITWNLRAADNAAAESDPRSENFRPTGQMQRVSQYLEGRSIAASRKQIEDDVPGRAQYLRLAMDHLTADGYAIEEPNANGGRYLRSVRPYREDDDV